MKNSKKRNNNNINNNTSQSLADQTRISLKKDSFSDLEILEIGGQVNREKYTLEESPRRAEIQNIENQNITKSNPTTSMLIQEEINDVELIKNIMTEKKFTLLVGN